MKAKVGDSFDSDTESESELETRVETTDPSLNFRLKLSRINS